MIVLANHKPECYNKLTTKENTLNKKKLLLVIVCLLLVHTQAATSLDIRTLLLTPPQKVSPIETNPEFTFLKEFNILTFALALYHLDAKEHLTKDIIKRRLATDCAVWKKALNIDFDLDNIDLNKRGFTRYYPFSINGKDFIVRIFDMKERHFLPEFDVFYEALFEDSGVGLQIIPGINTVLKSKRVEKVHLSNSAATSVAIHP